MHFIQQFASRRMAAGAGASLLLIGGLMLSGCGFGKTDAATRGQQLYQTCVPCHGTDGSGNIQVGAPNIAGMQEWYVEGELDKFRAGSRGMQFSDMEGMRMRPMALSLMTDDSVKLVAHYVQTMPQVRHAPSIPGDPQAGAALYTACSSCHGVRGEGKQALKAPRLAGLNDWYLATELRKFRRGIRGADPRDHEGKLMGIMERSLRDNDAIRNVVAYIGTLKP
ncbi:MAG TPA: c-type cytochrome [Candidatus Dormibacteraeota bacterium]|nr:c-type cytochrome [Candidatus Dormibacteraeota bacterium]